VGVVGVLEQVRVHLQSDVRVSVSELAADEDDVEAFADEQACEAVAEAVQGEPAWRLESCGFDSLPKPAPTSR
jgi:hypothetical protein